MNWLVLYTKPKNEVKVAERLAAAGINVYCPMVTTVKQWSDRKKKSPCRSLVPMCLYS
jgi:transcriptional antiterminator RfaH